MRELSILIPAHRLADRLEQTIDQLHAYLSNAALNLDYEIVIVPNRSTECEDDGTWRVAEAQREKNQRVRVSPLLLDANKGKALKAGFSISQGRYVLFVDGDLPFHLKFIGEALELLRSGVDFVTANRRLPESRIRCPARILSVVHRRFRLGSIFGNLVQFFFRVPTTDTQAGMKAFSRSLATLAFEKQSDAPFLCDIEYFLVAKQNGFRTKELPVDFSLDDEKTTVRIYRELFFCLYWLPRFFVQNLAGHYIAEPENAARALAPAEIRSKITADDWGISPGVNDGILDLIQRGVVTRVSVMAYGPHTGYRLDELLRTSAELGLHFDLTSQYARLFRAKQSLIVYLLNPLKGAAEKIQLFEGEIEAQLDKLKRAGIRCSYFDSHHHIHLLPLMARAMKRPVLGRGMSRVRVPARFSDGWSERFSLAMLSLFGRRALSKAGFRPAESFYPTMKEFQQPGRLQNQLITRDQEMIVHPALADDFEATGCQDTYRSERIQEHRVLSKLLLPI